MPTTRKILLREEMLQQLDENMVPDEASSKQKEQTLKKLNI
jgi:hypothetical protein